MSARGPYSRTRRQQLYHWCKLPVPAYAQGSRMGFICEVEVRNSLPSLWVRKALRNSNMCRGSLRKIQQKRRCVQSGKALKQNTHRSEMLRRREVLKHTFRFGHPSLPMYLPSTLIYSFFLYAPVASQARVPPYSARCALAHLAGVHATTIS
jgi:hypothetical protein